MNGRRLALILGTGAFLAAIAVVGGALEIGLSRPTIVVVGLLALAAGLSGLNRGYGVRSRAKTPDPERRPGIPVPGESLTGTIDDFRSATPGYVVSSRRTIPGLRAAAVAVLTRFDGDSIDEASRRLEAGTWTDDRTAAAFLSDSLELPTPSLRARFASVVSSNNDSRFTAGVRHSVAAIATISGDRATDGETDGNGDSLPAYDHDMADERRRSNGFSRASGAASNAHAGTRTTTTATEQVEEIQARRRRSTDHWTGIGAVALLAVGIGAVAEAPAVVLAGVVGVGYAGFARALEPPTLDLTLERTVGDDDPEPGDELEVTLTVTNESGSFVPNLRLIDGVPAGLRVVEGTSRLGTALRPGESVTLEYTVVARRGSHEFDPALALARDLSRSTEREFLVGCETTVVCEPVMRPLASPVALREATTAFAGRVRTADGGSGTTLHSVREYRKSDPLSRIDWNRRAKTGDLATLEFHEERTARVVVLVDARRAAYRAPEPDAAHAVDRSVDAAGRIASTLFQTGETVGLAAIGPVDRDATASSAREPCWLAPRSGRHHEAQFRDRLATHPQFETRPPENECRWRSQLRTLRRRLPADAQVVLLTPLCDRDAVDIARRLEARSTPVTVVSRDPTTDRTAGQQLARVARHVRQVDLQRAGIPVVDWPEGDSLDVAFARQAGGRQ